MINAVGIFAVAGEAGPPPLTDPYYSDRKAILNFQGADGSTTFIDDSILAQTVTPHGGVEITTAGNLFGDSCGIFNQGNLSIPATSDFLFSGSDDWQIEAWVKVTGQSTTHPAFSNKSFNIAYMTTSPSWYDRVIYWEVITSLTYGGDSIRIGNANFEDQASIPVPIEYGEWVHVAVSIHTDGGSRKLRMFVRGVKLYENPIFTRIYGSNSLPLLVGGVDTSVTWGALIGEMQGFRVTKGHADYIADFTPINTLFPTS